MPEYVKKPEIITVEQWFPGKKVEGIVEHHPRLYTLRGSCEQCGRSWPEHGWIRGGLIVCLGALVATDRTGMTYPISEEDLRTNYEPLIQGKVENKNFPFGNDQRTE